MIDEGYTGMGKHVVARFHIYGSGPVILRGPSAYLVNDPIFERLDRINYMPEVADIITTDYDHHVAGTAALASEKASYLASELINIVYRSFELNSHNGIICNDRIEHVDEAFRIWRREYLSRIRRTITWMGIAHMLAIPAFRRIIGTPIKRKSIVFLACNKKDTAECDAGSAVVNFLESIASTIKVYYGSLARILSGAMPELTLALPGGYSLDPIYSDLVSRLLYSMVSVETLLPMLAGLDTIKNIDVKEYIKDIINGNDFYKNKDKCIDALIVSTFVTKYKLAGSIIGLSITFKHILKRLLDIARKLPDYGSVGGQITRREALLELVNIWQDIVDTMESFIASISMPVAPPILLLVNGNHIEIPIPYKAVVDQMPKLPCCLFAPTLLSNTKPAPISIQKYIVEALFQDLSRSASYTTLKSLLEDPVVSSILMETDKGSCLGMVEGTGSFFRVLDSVGPLYMWSSSFAYMESEAMPSAFIQDILSKLYTDVWMGVQPALADLQEPTMIIERTSFTRVERYSISFIKILDGILSNIASVTDQVGRYWSLSKTLLNVAGGSYDAWIEIYYAILSATLRELEKELEDEKNNLDNIIHTNMYIYVKPILDITNSIIGIIKSLRHLVELLMKCVPHSTSPVDLKMILQGSSGTVVTLRGFDDYSLGLLLLPHINPGIIETDDVIRIDIAMTSTEIAGQVSTPEEAGRLMRNLLAVLSLGLLVKKRRRRGREELVIVKLEELLADNIRKAINDSGIFKPDEVENIDIIVYVPLRGVIKIFYHYAGRPIHSLTLRDLLIQLINIPEFTINVSILIRGARAAESYRKAREIDRDVLVNNIKVKVRSQFMALAKTL